MHDSEKADISEGSAKSDLVSSRRSGVNGAGTSSHNDTRLTQPGSRPVRYELVSARGNIFGPYLTATAAAQAAKLFWPDQKQDEERSGKGWDVQVAGS